MSTTNLQIRRATIDDLPKLAELWREERLPAAQLEKRFKEFQVVANREGEVLAAVGLLVAGSEGALHSEVIRYFDQADAMREQLWARVQVISQNFGLVRLWTQMSTPFWQQKGFELAGTEVLTKLPTTFGDAGQPWRVVQLREEAAGPAVSLEAEFALFKEAERERTERVMQRARALKVFAGAVAFIVFLLVMIWAFMFLRMQSRKGRM